MELIDKLGKFFRKSGKKTAVVGISGGVDSAVTFTLCVNALGAKNVHAYYLPFFENTEDTKKISEYAKKLESHFYAVSIKDSVESLCKASRAIDPVDIGNIMARVRMAFLYSKSRQHDGLVVGTGNKSELKIGYFTKYGDGGVDVLPLGNLYKTQVWELAKKLNVPQYFIDKPPSAGLWPEQTDESELGLTYDDLDALLQFLEEKPNLAVQKFGEEKVSKILERMRVFGHKLNVPPVL